MNNTLGITKDYRLLNHRISKHSPENPERIKGIYNSLEASSYEHVLKLYKACEIKDEDLLAIHSELYTEQIKHYALNVNPYSYDKDTYLMEESYYVAKLAAGACLELVDAIMMEEITRGFALIRPPGHHAEVGRGIGFCIFNNVALVAKYLINKYKLNRILIFDFDVHHGNGTQDIFYDSDKVLFVSIHQEDLFPFTGKISEFGKDAGTRYNVNIPVYQKYGDTEYNYLIGHILPSLAEQYLPQFILVSAGFDGHKEDHISEIELSTKWYGHTAELLKYIANKFCDNRLLYVLEGGYNSQSLNESILETINILSKNNIKKPIFTHSEKASKILRQIKNILQPKWDIPGINLE